MQTNLRKIRYNMEVIRVVCFILISTIVFSLNTIEVSSFQPIKITDEVIARWHGTYIEPEIGFQYSRSTEFYSIYQEEIDNEKRKAEELRMDISDKTKEILTRVVEAEVTGSKFNYNGHNLTYDELLISKIRVAQVFMNRVENNKSFKSIDSLYEALTHRNSSATFVDGRYYSVTITDITREAVELALKKSTPDYTNGALFFSSGTTTCAYGNYLFTDSVGHSFFK